MPYFSMSTRSFLQKSVWPMIFISNFQDKFSQKTDTHTIFCVIKFSSRQKYLSTTKNIWDIILQQQENVW